MVVVLYIVERLGQDVTKVDAAHDKSEFVDDALAVPSKVDERAGQNRTDDVKEWCHGLASNHFKVHIEGHGVLKVVGVGLQLVCVMVLKPQGVVGVVAPHLVCPAVAKRTDGVFAVIGVEFICSHGLPLLCYVVTLTNVRGLVLDEFCFFLFQLILYHNVMSKSSTWSWAMTRNRGWECNRAKGGCYGNVMGCDEVKL